MANPSFGSCVAVEVAVSCCLTALGVLGWCCGSNGCLEEEPACVGVSPLWLMMRRAADTDAQCTAAS